MTATVAGILLTGVHASRPTSGVGIGTLYSCTTHSLVYQTSDTGSTWTTWANLAGTGTTTTVATDPIWTTAGQLALATGSAAAAALAIGGNATVLKSNGTTAAWGLPTFRGARVRHANTQTVGTGGNIPLLFDTENWDTDAYHFTSAAALTGTVAKNSTAAIVGTSTLFTSELAVNQVISIPGTATEIGVVKTITDNTHLTLWQTMANTASGQTATRQSCFLAVPSGLGGTYHCSGGFNWTTVTTAKNSLALIYKNGNLTGSVGTAYAVSSQVSTTSLIQYLTVDADIQLADGDYIALHFINNESGTVTIATNDAWSPHLSLALLGV